MPRSDMAALIAASAVFTVNRERIWTSVSDFPKPLCLEWLGMISANLCKLFRIHMIGSS